MADVNMVQIATINYEVFVDGNRALGTASVDLPELNYMTSETKGAGIAGQHDTPIIGHLENLETTLHWRSIFQKPIDLMTRDAVNLSLRGAMERYDAGTGVRRPLSVRIELRALSAGLTLGKLEPAEQTDTETKLTCDVVKIIVDGKEYFEHDVFNFVHKINGVDLLADVRLALGL